jgi:V/A-type H+-transporting ATPase subunit D
MRTERIIPTRMNLLLKEEEIRQVTQGIDVLSSKRDVLLQEFYSALRPLFTLRNQLQSTGKEVLSSLILSLGFEGKEKLVSYTAERELEVDLSEQNLWGVRVLELRAEISMGEMEFGEIGASLHISDTREKFVEFIKLALRILPEEVKLKRLGGEIKSISRKINYLEKYVLPELFEQVKYIQEMLEQVEHEDFFRLKMLKKKKYGR